MSTLYYFFFFVVAISILIVVHELGHFTAARLCGVKVLRFSLGFGKPLLACRFGADRTEWVLCPIPLGGYVKMLNEREAPVAVAELPRAFNTQSVLKRAIIVAAGPISNLLLAVVLYFGLACHGSRDFPATLGEVAPGTPAALAGLRAGDTVLSLDGLKIQGWTELRWQVVQHGLGDEGVNLTVDRDGAVISNLVLSVKGLKLEDKGQDPVRQLGLTLPSLSLPPIIDEVLPGRPALAAGFRKGDVVRKVDGKDIATWKEFTDQILDSGGRQLVVEVERAGVPVLISVTPKPAQPAQPGMVKRLVAQLFGAPKASVPPLLPRYQIGAAPLPPTEEFMLAHTTPIQYGIFDGAGYAARQTVDMAVFDLRAFWHILTGSLSWKNVSGPIAIADVAGQSAEAGPEAFLAMLAALSVSLGVLNLLPIPILDGGHLLYYVSECIRGRSLSEQAEMLGEKIGLAILVLLMSLAFFNDLNRVFFG